MEAGLAAVHLGDHAVEALGRSMTILPHLVTVRMVAERDLLLVARLAFGLEDQPPGGLIHDGGPRACTYVGGRATLYGRYSPRLPPRRRPVEPARDREWARA